MTHFSFRSEFDSGRSLEFIPDFAHPLGVAQLYAARDHAGSAIEMTLEGDNPVIDGTTQYGRGKIKANIVFHEAPMIFALVSGGWLPLPFAMPPRFLVDRNVMIMLKKLRLGQTTLSGSALNWWTRLFAQGSALFNPYPYALEAGFQRRPTFDEFVAAFEEGATELRSALPACGVVQYSPNDYQAAYSQLTAFDERSTAETAFLLRSSLLVAQRVSRGKEQAVRDTILATADQLNIPRGAMVVLAILSCLYDASSGGGLTIGRDIVKPKATYTERHAFNTISDLRHIELAAAGQSFFQDGAFALCTCDRGLAAFWSALAPRGVRGANDVIELTFDLSTELFPRLSEDEVLDLRELLAG